MNRRQILLIGFFCLIILTTPGLAREWRSIFPLHTTRGELLKLLGEPILCDNLIRKLKLYPPKISH